MKRQVFLVFFIVLSNSLALWLKLKHEPKPEDDFLEDEDFFMAVDDMSDTIFNSRGPKSIYRGIEEVDENWNYEEDEDYDEDDNLFWNVGSKLWDFTDF